MEAVAPKNTRSRDLPFHPYPQHLVQKVALRSGESVIIRPIRPQDAAIEKNFVRLLSANSKHFRFMEALQELNSEMRAHSVDWTFLFDLFPVPIIIVLNVLEKGS